MTGALIILAVTVFVGVILYLLDRRRRPDSISETTADADVSNGYDTVAGEPASAETASKVSSGDSEAQSECCGLHIICEKELNVLANNEILYYDDEELDRFANTDPKLYSARDVEEFRDVLMTLLPQDVPGWARSLDARHIRPPQEVRDELLILLQDLS